MFSSRFCLRNVPDCSPDRKTLQRERGQVFFQHCAKWFADTHTLPRPPAAAWEFSDSSDRDGKTQSPHRESLRARGDRSAPQVKHQLENRPGRGARGRGTLCARLTPLRPAPAPRGSEMRPLGCGNPRCPSPHFCNTVRTLTL